MIEFWDVTIPELTDDIPRKAYIYVPDSFQWDPGRRYPVLYMFDGHNVFFDSHATYGKSWGMREYLEHTDTQLIVAAVECNHSPDNDRLREYSPYDFSDPAFGEFRGKGDLTLRWFTQVFKPYIDSHYPTLSGREHTFIGGSSMGGLMSLYAVLSYNHIFSGAMCMSPSLWVAPNKLHTLIRQSALFPDTDIYIDCGEQEGREQRDRLRQFFSIIHDLQSKYICVTSRVVPGGTHCEASWERQLPFAIPALMYRQLHR